MKTLWNIVAVLAVMNLAAVVAVVLWLRSSDRLDSDRVQRIREMLSETVTDEKARGAAEAVAKVEQTKTQNEQAKRTGDSVTSEQAITAARDRSEAELASVMRIREESRQLQAALQKQQAELEKEKAEVAEIRKKLDAKQAEINNTGGDKQFKQALSALEAQKPAAAKQILQVLLAEGKRTETLDYLAAMEEGVRAKIIGEFVKGNDGVATELLEGLRTRGITAPASPATAGNVPGAPATPRPTRP